MWKCSIHPAFEEILVLRTFLQKKFLLNMMRHYKRMK